MARTDKESTAAFRSRCEITRRHDLKHVEYYELRWNEMSIIDYFQEETNRQFYSGHSATIFKLHFKQTTELAYSGYKFVTQWEYSKDNIQVLFMHYFCITYTLFVYYLYIIYTLFI